MTNKGPEKKFRAGNVTATVWDNKREVNEEIFRVRSVSFEKRYLDKNGEWNSANSYDANDVAKLILVANEAYKYMALNKEKNNIREEMPHEEAQQQGEEVPYE